MRISCSARKDRQPIKGWLDFFRNHAETHSNFQYDYKDIDYVFGQVAGVTPLWGGRVADRPSITKVDIHWLYDNGIGLKLPLTNKFISDKQYKESIPFLKQYHRKENAIITATDELAKHIKNDFPDYQIEASCIQDIVDTEKLEQKISLGVYDTIVLPIHMNDDVKFLESIKDKEKIRLFLNVECSYACPKKVCYGTTSKINGSEDGVKNSLSFRCSFWDFGMERTFHKDHINWNNFYFDKSKFDKIGINKYKLLPPLEGQQRTVTMYRKNRKLLKDHAKFIKDMHIMSNDIKEILKMERMEKN
jgi:hypothetical protein